MKNFLITILIVGMAAAGCGREHATSPVPQWHSWDQVVLAETRGEAGIPVSEISVLSDGALTLVVRQGDTVSSRGLLSGNNMETLTGLIDALPPSSFVAPGSCPTGRFLLTLAVRGTVRTYAFGTCDTSDTVVPAAVRGLQEFLSDVGASTSPQAPHLVVLQPGKNYSVLLQGTQSALHQPVRMLLQDRDALARFLREHAPDRPVAVPIVDFGRQLVVAEWLGDRPTTGYTAAFDGANITPTGWFRLHFRLSTPGPACAVAAQITQPFVLVAIDRHPEEMLFQDVTAEVDCLHPSATGSDSLIQFTERPIGVPARGWLEGRWTNLCWRETRMETLNRSTH